MEGGLQLSHPGGTSQCCKKWELDRERETDRQTEREITLKNESQIIFCASRRMTCPGPFAFDPPRATHYHIHQLFSRHWHITQALHDTLAHTEETLQGQLERSIRASWKFFVAPIKRRTRTSRMPFLLFPVKDRREKDWNGRKLISSLEELSKKFFFFRFQVLKKPCGLLLPLEFRKCEWRRPFSSAWWNFPDYSTEHIKVQHPQSCELFSSTSTCSIPRAAFMRNFCSAPASVVSRSCKEH